MYTPYRPSESPPEIDTATYEKNNRNSIRQEAIGALGTVISRLDELDWDEGERVDQIYLEVLRSDLTHDMED